MLKRGQLKLGVNIDHVATLRQARGTLYPDPTAAALRAEQAGADYITLHLREDRRHIQVQDVLQMKARLQTAMNLEMAINSEMLVFAEQVRPRDCCLVPEKRAELTTEGGLDVVGQATTVKNACTRLRAGGIRVSLFIDPDVSQIDAAKVAGADIVEIHTGRYANASLSQQKGELDAIAAAADYAHRLGLQVNAGHGLNYENTQALAAAVVELSDLNIGHAIIARALFVGIETAVIEMRNILQAVT